MEKLLSEIKHHHDKIVIIYDNDTFKNELDTLFELIFNVLEEKYTIFKTLDSQQLTSDEMMFETSALSYSNKPYIVITKNIFSYKLTELSSLSLIIDKNNLYLLKNRYGESNFPIDLKGYIRKNKIIKLINKSV